LWAITSAGARCPEQRREAVASADRLRDLLDRARLVSGRGEGGIEPERGHLSSIANPTDGLGPGLVAISRSG
jgi:hypothetical protein